MKRIFLLALILSLTGFRSYILPIHLTVICDRSSSGMNMTCEPERIRSFIEVWIESAIARPGSSVNIWTVGQRFGDARRVFSCTVPSSWGRGANRAKSRFVKEMRKELEDLDLPQIALGSAILEAIKVVSEDLLKRHGLREIVILSDLRQVTPPKIWNFERTVPSASTFIDWARENNLLPDLEHAKVTVCGVHSTETSPKGHAMLLEAWTKAFESMNSEVQIYQTCD